MHYREQLRDGASRPGFQITCELCGKSYRIRNDCQPPEYFRRHVRQCQHIDDKSYEDFLEYRKWSEMINADRRLLPHFIEQCPVQYRCLITQPLALPAPVLPDNNEDECSICLDPLKCSEIYSTPCGHKFHALCISKVEVDTCPLCRQNIGMNHRTRRINNNASNDTLNLNIAAFIREHQRILDEAREDRLRHEREMERQRELRERRRQARSNNILTVIGRFVCGIFRFN